jgi:hypothetical protein
MNAFAVVVQILCQSNTRDGGGRAAGQAAVEETHVINACIVDTDLRTTHGQAAFGHIVQTVIYTL